MRQLILSRCCNFSDKHVIMTQEAQYSLSAGSQQNQNILQMEGFAHVFNHIAISLTYPYVLNNFY